MRLQRSITQFIALSLAVLTFVGTSPVSAAEIASPTNIGSVSAVGSVQLRGLGISEGTLFSGDRLNVAPGGYAKVVLGTGPKVEVFGNSDVTVSKDTDAINIQMTSGNVAFSGNGQKPVRVRVGSYEITATGQSRGRVSFVGSGALDVRALDGTVSVRNTATKQSFTVMKGNERLVSLGGSNQPGALLASTVPGPIPAAPAMPQGQQSGGKKTALIMAAITGSAVAMVLLMSKNDDTDTEAANRLNKIQALNNVSAVSTTAAQSAQVAASVSQSATTALGVISTNAAIAASPVSKAALTLSANNLIAKANTAASTLASLLTQLSALQTQISAFGLTSAQQTQLNSLYGQVEAQRLVVNSSITDLNNLINSTNTAAGATVVTNPGLQPVPPANVASPSNP
jgi:hypothetical protein